MPQINVGLNEPVVELDEGVYPEIELDEEDYPQVEVELEGRSPEAEAYLKSLQQLDAGITYYEDGENFPIFDLGIQKTWIPENAPVATSYKPTGQVRPSYVDPTTGKESGVQRQYERPRYAMELPPKETTTYDLPLGGAESMAFDPSTAKGISAKNLERSFAFSPSKEDLEYARTVIGKPKYDIKEPERPALMDVRPGAGELGIDYETNINSRKLDLGRALIRSGNYSVEEAMDEIGGLDSEPWMQNPVELIGMFGGLGAYRGVNIALKAAMEGLPKFLGKRMAANAASMIVTGMPTEIALGGIAEQLELSDYPKLAWLISIGAGIASGLTVEDFVDRKLIARTEEAIKRFPKVAEEKLGKNTVQHILDVGREYFDRESPAAAIRRMLRDVEKKINDQRGSVSFESIRKTVIGFDEPKPPAPPEIKTIMDQMPPDYMLSYDGSEAGLHYFTPKGGPAKGSTLALPEEDFSRENLLKKLLAQEQLFSKRPMPEPPKPDPKVNFEKWLGKSVVREPVYHSTAKEFDEFSMFMGEGFAHLGTKEQAVGIMPTITGGYVGGETIETYLERLGRDKLAPSTMPMYVRIENPIRLHDTGSFYPGEIAYQLRQRGVITQDQLDKVEQLIEGFTYKGELAPSSETSGFKKAVSLVRKYIEDAGYDGIVYLNRHESVGEKFYGTTWGTDVGGLTDPQFRAEYPGSQDSYIPLRPNQIKSVFNQGEWSNYSRKLSYATAPMLSVETDEDGNPRLDQPMLLGTMMAMSALGVRKYKTRRTKWGKFREILKKDLPHIEREANKANMLVSQYLGKHGWNGVAGEDIPSELSSHMLDYYKNTKELPFVKETDEMARDAMSYKHKRDFYRDTEFDKIINSDTKDEIMEMLGITAETSAQAYPYRNLHEALSAWVRWKSGQPIEEILEVVSISKDRVKKVIEEGKDFFEVAYDMYGRRLGNSWKIQDFAETLYLGMKDPEQLKNMTRAVIDYRMNQYFFPYRTKPIKSKIAWERANEKTLEVRDYLRKYDNPDWDVDRVQSALWYHIKEQRVKLGLDRPASGSGKITMSYGEAVTQIVNDYGNVPEYTAVYTHLTLPEQVKMYHRQVLTGKERSILDHHTNERFFIALPEKAGTGTLITRGEERKRPDRVPAVHLYERRQGKAGWPEHELINAKHKYRAVVDSDRIYNLDVDAERYQERFPDVTTREWAMLEDGWIGMSSGRVTLLWQPTRVNEMRKYKLAFSPISSYEKAQSFIDGIEVIDPKTGEKKIVKDVRKGEKLKAILEMEYNGEPSEINQIVEADIDKFFDHPLIDIIERKPSKGWWEFSGESGYHVILEAGNEKVLRGRFAMMLDEYAQDKGLGFKIIEYDGNAPKPGKAHVERGDIYKEDIIPDDQGPSTLIKFPENLTDKQVRAVQQLMKEHGFPGGEFIPDTDVLHIGHVLEYKTEEKGGKTVRTLVNPEAEHRERMNALIDDLNKNGFGAIRTKRVWAQVLDIGNDWKKNKLGQTYRRIIDEGRKTERDLGFIARPPVVRGGRGGAAEYPGKQFLGFDYAESATANGASKAFKTDGKIAQVEDPDIFIKALKDWKRPERPGPKPEPPGTTLRLPYETITGPAAGIWYGAEQDEEGNWRLNPERALKGALIGTLASMGIRNRKKVLDPIMKTYTKYIGQPIWDAVGSTYRAALNWANLGEIFDVNKDPLVKKMFADYRRDTQRLWLKAVETGEELRRLAPTVEGQRQLREIMAGREKTNDPKLLAVVSDYKKTFDELREGLKAYDLLQYSRFDVLTKQEQRHLKMWGKQDFDTMERHELVDFAAQFKPEVLGKDPSKISSERLREKLRDAQQFNANRLKDYHQYGSAEQYVPLMYEKYEGLTRKNRKVIEETANEYRRQAARAPEQETKNMLLGMANELDELTGRRFVPGSWGQRSRTRAFRAGLSQSYGHRRKDIPPEVQKAMGMIEEVSYPVAKAMGEQSTDIRKFQLYKYIAENPDWCRDESTMIKGLPQDFTKITDSRFGDLNGKYVRNDVLSDLKDVADMRRSFEVMVDRMLGFYKAGKVVYNPAAQFRNFLSNGILAYMGDVNPATKEGAKAYKDAIEALAQGSSNKLWKEAEEWGLFAGTFNKAELYELREELKSLRSLEGEQFKSKMTGFLRKMMNVPAKSYEYNEKLFKMAVFAKARADGLSVEKAGAKAEKHLFNYSDVPPIVKFGKRWVSPFMTFSWKAIPLFAETAITKPWKIAAIGAAMYGAEQYAMDKLGYDQKGFTDMREKFPEYMRGKMFRWIGPNLQLLMPWKDDWGNDLYLDLAYILPWGAIGEPWGQSDIPMREFLPNAPMFTIASAWMQNRDAFTGEDIVSELDKRMQFAVARTWGKRLEYAYKQLAPSLAPGGYGWSKLEAGIKNALRETEGEEPEVDWAGRPRDLTGAVLSTLLGIKLNPMDEKRMKRFEMMQRDNLIRAIGKEKSKIAKQYKRNKIDRYEYESQIEKLKKLANDMLKPEEE